MLKLCFNADLELTTESHLETTYLIYLFFMLSGDYDTITLVEHSFTSEMDFAILEANQILKANSISLSYVQQGFRKPFAGAGLQGVMLIINTNTFLVKETHLMLIP